MHSDFANMNKLKHMNLDKACRICITQKKYLKDIHKTRIPKIVEMCTSIKISENDGLPHKICGTCFKLITNLYSFKKKIEQNERILKDFISNKSKAKKHEDIVNTALEDANITDKSHTDSKLESNDEAQESVQISADSLPPLIPIASGENAINVKRVCRELPKDTPPLVPIKPLVNIKAIANVVPELEYRCYICSKQFKDISKLKQHKLNNCKQKSLQCNICLREFSEPKKLIGHLKGHKVVKDHLCKLCGKTYPNYSTFVVHMRSHTGEKPFKCQICHKGFVRWANVRLHMKCHEDERPYACDMCPKAFKISSNLDRHKRTHFGIEPYTCNYCQKSYSQHENLRMHIRTYHTNERPFLCNMCGKSFVSSTRLNRHMWIHSGIKRYKCRICPKSYLNTIDLKNHESQHSGRNVDELKNYRCDRCDKKFFHPCRLAQHKRVHEKCHICKKVMESKELYEKHLQDDHGIDEVEEERVPKSEEEVEVSRDEADLFFVQK